jgi:hypothetical protein
MTACRLADRGTYRTILATAWGVNGRGGLRYPAPGANMQREYEGQ